MFFNLAWRNSKRNRSENLIYFLTMVTAVATILYRPLPWKPGRDALLGGNRK